MCDFDIRGISCYIYFTRNMCDFDIRGDIMLYIFYKKYLYFLTMLLQPHLRAGFQEIPLI